MKKILSMFLALCMVVTLLPVTAMAEEIHTPIGTSGEITSFAPLTEAEKTVSLGTSSENLELPETLTAAVRTAVPAGEDYVQDSGSPETATPTAANEPEWEETTVDIPVKWDSTPEYDMDTEGAYVFTPVIEGYTVSAALPEITVTVGEIPPIAAKHGLASPMAATEYYDLWVGGVQVTSENKDGIIGEGITGTATYDPDTNTLTLNGVNIVNSYNYGSNKLGIYSSNNSTALTINLAGTNTVTAEGITSGNSYGIWSLGSLTISGDGTLTVSCGTALKSNGIVGIFGMGDITISDSAQVSATGGTADNESYGIFGMGDITISDSAQVSATSGTAYTSLAINKRPVFTGYTSYQWRTAKEGAFTPSTTKAYEWANTHTYVEIKPQPTTINYDLWVGGVQVTSDNASDVLGDGGTVTYDPTDSILTLNGANITDYHTQGNYDYGIYHSNLSSVNDLTIHLIGTNRIAPSGTSMRVCGIYSEKAGGSLTFSAAENGELTILGNDLGQMIYCTGPIIIGGGTISGTGGNGIFSSGGSVTINGGNVTANSNSADASGSGIACSSGSLSITAGTVTASSLNGYGVNVYNAPTVTGGTLTAIGEEGAIVFYNNPLSASDGMRIMASTSIDGSDAVPYDSANIATYKYLKFEPASGVSEQFSLTPGGTYYFDLSGEKDNIGTINTALPDTTLHYVPFTYVGTVNAYSLTSAMATTEAYATENKSDRSLFVGDYVIGHTIVWDDLNTNGLIFGKPFATNYKLRSLSAGSSSGSGTANPATNEWDQILDKAESEDNTTGWIKNWSNISSWGLDTHANNSAQRAVRGYSGARDWYNYSSGSISVNIGFRPALEVLNPDALGADGLKVVTLSLNGSKLKESTADINIICAGDSFKAPSGEGLIAPSGKTFAGWKDSGGTTYAADATVPNTVTGLTAQWTASDTTAPVVSSVTVPANDTYLPGNNLDFTVNFDESVIVDTTNGLPYIALTIGSTSQHATYVSGSGTSSLTFRYTVQAGDSDSDGVSVGALTLNGGTIQDTAGNDATLTLNSVGNTSGILVDTSVAPSITGQPSPQTVNEGQSATFSVTATGTGLTYQWQVNTGSGFTNISSGGLYSGAMTTALTITGANTWMNGYQYRAVVSGTVAPAATSNSATLMVNAAPIKTVSVGSQNGTATAGTAGSLTYPVTTANIAGGTYAVSVADLPAGVTVSNGGNVTISGSSGTLTLTVADTASAGTTGTLVLTLDGATSAAFSIVIGEPAPLPNLSVANVTLDAVTVGYISSNYKSVVITNGGDAQATISNVTTDRPSVFSIHSGQFFVAANCSINSWQIRAATGLAVGTHTATIIVTYDGGRTATATVSITVNAVGSHTVTFNPNGGMVGETSRSVAPGAAVGTLPTPTRSGSYSFDGWYTAANGGTQISASTTVSANVIYYAHWTYTGGGGSGSGGGSSSNDNSSPVIVTPPAPDKPNSPTQGEVKVPGTVDGKGNVTVSLTDKAVTDAFDKAFAEAKKNGTEQNGITVVIRVDTGSKTGANVMVNLPKTVQDTIIAKKIVNTIVVVDNPDIRVGMDLATVQEINKQAKSDVNITATRTDSGKLTTEAKKAIGSRPVFDLKVNYGNGKAVSSFGSGNVSVTIPYTLGSNEKAGNVQAVYVDSKGKVHWLVNSVYDSVEKVLRFSTDHFSTYGIGYKQTNTAFTDIAGHWAKGDIEFVVSRGLFSGTSETKFSPNTAMTRGMFVTVLGRLANADVSGYAKSSFSDVKDDAYYMGYVEWASKNNIVNGVGNGKFAPDQPITREQMAVIMSNYAKTIGYTLPKVHIKNIFADNGKISTYAKEAVKQMQMAGVISGKNGNLYDPQGTATRAEVSAVLRRFVELAISSDTAQGWSMNDSGKWMYFKDGKPLTSKQDIDGAAYTFDQYGVTTDVPKNLRYTTYTVQKGDSFWSISRKLGCPMSELERLNNKSRFSLILPGEVLRVPEK